MHICFLSLVTQFSTLLNQIISLKYLKFRGSVQENQGLCLQYYKFKVSENLP